MYAIYCLFINVNYYDDFYLYLSSKVGKNMTLKVLSLYILTSAGNFVVLRRTHIKATRNKVQYIYLYPVFFSRKS